MKKAIIAYYGGLDNLETEWGIYSAKKTFSRTLEALGADLISFIPLSVSGKTYQERRADLQNKAIEYSNECSAFPWSYGELATIGEFFERNGRRYGLTKEFRENGII